MFKLDNAFLEELGLGSLPPADKNKMLAHIYETLEMRVGMKLAERMTNEQLDEFEGYINRQDEAGALKWLESNFPDYKNVVAQELEQLKQEIKQVSAQIVADAQNAAAAQPQPQQANAAMPPPPQAAQPAPQQQSSMPPAQQAPAQDQSMQPGAAAQAPPPPDQRQ